MTYEIKCEICDHAQVVGSCIYWTCPMCGQVYRCDYEDHAIILTPEQRELLRLAAKAEIARRVTEALKATK